MSGQRLAGFGPQLRLALRRDRWKLPAWVLGTALFAAYCSAAIELAVPQESDLSAMTALMSGPAGVLMSGPGFGFAHPSYANVFAGVYGLYVFVLAACMSILVAVRHTRGDEESERLELIRALPVARTSQVAVAATMLLLANVATALICAVIVGPRFGWAGGWLFACAVAMVGLVFGAVALVAAQLVTHARTATGLAFVVLGAAFIARGVGDMLVAGGSALSWVSPFAWAQQTRVFVADRWWPLAVGVAVTVLLCGVAWALQAGRDLGAGLLPGRAGRMRGSRFLAGPAALALRLQRGAIFGWAAAAGITGIAFGSLTSEVSSSLGKLSDPVVIAALGGDPARLVDGYLAVCLLFGVVLASCFGILAASRLAAEEHSGRTEMLLALPLGRTRWLLAQAGVAALGSLGVLLIAGLATGAAAAVSTGDASQTMLLTGAALAFAPAVAVLIALALLGYALRPGLAGIAWVAAGYGFLVTVLGGPLKLPDAANWFSVFGQVGELPLAALSVAPLVWLSVVAIALMGAALVRFRSRAVPL